MGAKLRGTWPRVQLDFVQWHLIFSAINAVDFALIHMSISSHAPSRRLQMTLKFSAHSRSVGSQDGICYVSPLQYLKS